MENNLIASNELSCKNIKKEQAKILIVWSSGFDSTAVLLKAIKEKKHFDLVYFQLANNKEKSIMELKARAKIKQLIKDEYGLEYKDTTIKIPFHHHELGHPVSPQPFYWVTSIVQAYKPEYEEVWLGYISGDCFWHKKTHFEKAFKQLIKLAFQPEEECRLIYPFEWEQKKNLLYYYTENAFTREVFKNIWTCEYPKEITNATDQCEQCFNRKEDIKDFCTPCTNFKPIVDEFNQIESEKNKNLSYKTFYQDKLETDVPVEVNKKPKLMLDDYDEGEYNPRQQLLFPVKEDVR